MTIEIGSYVRVRRTDRTFTPRTGDLPRSGRIVKIYDGSVRVQFPDRSEATLPKSGIIRVFAEAEAK